MSCTSIPLRSSTGVSPGFDLLRRRSPAFGLRIRGSARRYHAVPRRKRSAGGYRIRVPHLVPAKRHSGCGLSVSLCHNGLYRFNSPRLRTPRPVILDGTRNAAWPFSRRLLRWPLRSASVLSRCGATGQHVSCSFHRPHGLLFIFRSSYWCAIGLRTCLGLGDQRSRLRPEIPVRPTLLPAASVSSPTGPLPSSASSSKGIRLDTWRHCRRHMSVGFPRPIRLGLYPFHSPLLRASRLLSLPAPTMMLRLRAFPPRVQCAAGSPAFPARPGPKATFTTARVPGRRG